MHIARILSAVSALAVALPLAAAAGGRVYTDAEILGVLASANQGELDAAALAVDKAQIAGVKRFAARMRKDHGEAKLELADVAAKAGLTPADTDLSGSLTKHGSDEAGQLGYLKGDEFDGPYIDAQVSDHETLLREIDEDLMPAAKDESVASLLRKLRGAVAHHLAMARRLQGEFARPKR